MNTFLYIILAVIGTIFGSFFTLAVYRIPRKENIIYVRSHCTSCNHRLEFLDLIPVLSYIFLGGKCRYCKEPIIPRYLLLELLSGAVFLLIALAMNITVYSTIADFVIYGYTVLIVSILCIIMGIGKNINMSVILLGFLIRTIYLVFIDNTQFTTFFFQTNIFLILALIIYLIYRIIVLKRNNLDTINSQIFGTIFFVGLLTYILGLELAIIVMALGLIVSLISKYIVKSNNNYIMYISLISIFLIVLISNDSVYEYINNIIYLR